MNAPADIPRLVRELRERTGLTQEKFAAKLGVTFLTINRWENGKAKPALRAAGLKPRSLYQTRHSFATLMLDAGELPGWVQSMMGHESLKMILERYYSYIKNYERDDGQAFMEKVYKPVSKANTANALSNEKSSDLAPNLPQKRNRKSG